MEDGLCTMQCNVGYMCDSMNLQQQVMEERSREASQLSNPQACQGLGMPGAREAESPDIWEHKRLRSPGIGIRQSGALGKKGERPGILMGQITAQEQRGEGRHQVWASLSCLDGDLFQEL